MRQDNEIENIWFSSDFHLLHPKIVSICDRPTTVEEHDDWLIDRINSVVKKKDMFYILGDISMANKEKTEKLLHRINGIKVLIEGNHDTSIKNSTVWLKSVQRENFTFNSPSYPNIHIVLDHFPLASWERKVHGAMHLHGHTHNRFVNRGLSFDIGVDANNYLPLNLEQVFDKMTKLSLDLF